MVSPLHTGLLLVAIGVAGVAGSVNVIGLGNVVDEQAVDINVTTKFEYVAAFNPLIFICPLPLDVMVVGPCATAFLK